MSSGFSVSFARPARNAEEKRSGLVINIGSILGRVTIPFFGLYGATKHAVEALTDTYRYELSQLGIDVVLIQPVRIQPSCTHRSRNRLIRQSHQLRRCGQFPAGIEEFLHGVFAGADAPDPHDIAQEIAALIETPAGQRPARVVKGIAFGADKANAAIAPFQAQLISGLGFESLSILNAA